jgi:nucleoside-diphosphate-sugar epimerase
MAGSRLPASILDTRQLEDLLSDPPAGVIQTLSQLPGSLLVLGAGGKMGPSLVRMARRASEAAGVKRPIAAASRFTDPQVERSLRELDVSIHRGDLLAADFVRGLPDADLVVFMAGMKFGTARLAAQTWAMNTYVPALVAERFRDSRLLVFSTGNVYPLVDVGGGGSVETDRCEPVGEYGMSALGRERTFEYFSHQFQTSVSIVRLNYAVEMRYGVLVDLAQRIYLEQRVDVSMGYANAIWQADANAMALSALADAQSPPWVVNVAGPQFSVRTVCHQLGDLLGKTPRLTGSEAPTALLSNAHRAWQRYGPPAVSLDQLITCTADWIGSGKETWSKPTHFQVRDGRF